MIISRVESKNILTYEHLDVDLEKLPGLNLIIGVNEDKSGSSSNGAGKTNLLEIILWGLFGRTIRYGDSKRDFIRNERRKGKLKKCKDYHATVYVKDGDHQYKIHRSKEGVSLYIDNEPDVSKRSKRETQKDINSLLNTSYDAFLNTNIFAVDKVVAFASAREKDRNEIVNKILGLEILEKCYKEVKTRLKDLSSSIDQLEYKIESIDGSIEELEDDIKNKEEKLKEEKEEAQSNLQELEDSKHQKEEKLEELENKKEDFTKKKKKKEEELAEIQESYSDKMTDIERELDTNQKAKEELDLSIRSSENEIERLNKLLSSSEKLIGSRCPTCGSKVTEDTIDDAKEHIENSKYDNKQNIIAIKEPREELVRNEEKIGKKYSELEQESEEAEGKITKKIESLKDDINDTKSDIKVVTNEIKNIDKEIKKASKAKLVYQEVIDDLKKKITKHQKVRAVQEKELEKIEEGKALLEFWEKGFGSAGLKSYIINKIKPKLNKIANDYSRELTDGSIRIDFDMQTKVRAGVVREKIEVKAINEYGSDIYNGNSSGERTRIDIAILKALQKVSTNRSFDQDWFDEVTTHIDDFGGERFISMLLEELNNKTVYSTFVISHLSAMKNKFDSILTCTKTDGISRLSIS